MEASEQPKQPTKKRKPSPGVLRHKGRILALQALFEADIAGHHPDNVLERSLVAEEPAPESADYALRLIQGIASTKQEIDAQIEESAPAFPIQQIPVVDRNVLRIAVYELMYQPDVPLKVAINEAVELSKRFGGENSSSFVNGVTGTIAGRVR